MRRSLTLIEDLICARHYAKIGSIYYFIESSQNPWGFYYNGYFPYEGTKAQRG